MKKSILAVILLATVVLVAFPAGVSAQPTVDRIQLKIPLAGSYDDLPDPCEDLVHVAGTLHVNGHRLTMDDGSQLTVLSVNPQGAVTQGVESGNLYRGVGVGLTVESTLGPGETFTWVDVFMQVPEYGVHYVVHGTVNANGEVTAEIDHALSPGFSCADLAG